MVDSGLQSRDNRRVEPLPVLLLGCIAGLGFSLSGLLAAARGKRSRRSRSARPDKRLPAVRERELSELRAGDIVQYGGAYLSVRRSLQLAAAGSWQLLGELSADSADSADNARAARLLLIGRGEAGSGSAEAVWLLTALPEPHKELLQTPHDPASELLPHEGLRYRLIGRHHTAVRALTSAATAFSGPDGEDSLSLLCYRGPGARRLLVTRFRADASARLYAGEIILAESLSILGGS